MCPSTYITWVVVKHKVFPYSSLLLVSHNAKIKQTNNNASISGGKIILMYDIFCKWSEYIVNPHWKLAFSDDIVMIYFGANAISKLKLQNKDNLLILWLCGKIIVLR